MIPENVHLQRGHQRERLGAHSAPGHGRTLMVHRPQVSRVALWIRDWRSRIFPAAQTAVQSRWRREHGAPAAPTVSPRGQRIGPTELTQPAGKPAHRSVPQSNVQPQLRGRAHGLVADHAAQAVDRLFFFPLLLGVVLGVFSLLLRESLNGLLLGDLDLLGAKVEDPWLVEAVQESGVDFALVLEVHVGEELLPGGKAKLAAAADSPVGKDKKIY